MHRIIWVLLLLLFSTERPCHADDPIHFSIVIPSYNNERWCEAGLISVFTQTYPLWELIFLNDCSTDLTGQKVEQLVDQYGVRDRCTIIHNTKRRGAMANYYRGIRRCAPERVIVALDGDDSLANKRVLAKLAKIYSNSNVWTTCGNTSVDAKRHPRTYKYPDRVIKENSFRSYPLWLGRAPRTFRAKLFHLIPKRDLFWKHTWVPTTSDLAYYFPILEMASDGHIFFVRDVLYRVNTKNSISDLKQKPELQRTIDQFIRSKPPYAPLKTLF